MPKLCAGCVKLCSSFGLLGGDNEELAALNAQLDGLSALPAASLSAEADSMGTVVVLRCGGAKARLSLFGAHLLSWKDGTTGEDEERLWMSGLSALDGSAPIRGGVPIAFPQFADQGPLPLHGFARTAVWAVDDAGTSASSVGSTGSGPEVTLALTMSDDAATRASAWGEHRFRLTYVVKLTPTTLRMSLRVANVGAAPFRWSGCLHTYLRAADSAKVRVRGLRGLTYTDKVAAMELREEAEEALALADASAASGGFVDRIYHHEAGGGAAGHDPVLHWDESGAAAALTVTQSTNWTDTVVFNPWEKGKKGAKGPDFDDDGYKYLLCLEPAVAKEQITLEPGADWIGWQELAVGFPTTADL